jgi:hypothetical protein
MKKAVVSALLLLVLYHAALAGDVIELKSGEKVEGRLVDESPTEVTIHTGKTRLVLPKSMIEVMKIEMACVHLSEGRKLTGKIEKETDHAITLRMKLGGITIDKMDIDHIERKVVERKPVVSESVEEKPGSEDQIPGAKKIRWPRRKGRLKQWEIEILRNEASQLMERKQYRDAAAKYDKILATKPKDAMAHYDIACAYALLGEKDKAVMHLRMAVAAGYASFERIERNLDFKDIRTHKDYREIFKKRDAIQLQAAKKQLRKLRKQFGHGYTYEIDETRKLIFATNQSLEMLTRMKEHLSRFADAQYKMLWDYRPSYYITIICPDKEGFKKVICNPGTGGRYLPGEKSLISLDIGPILDHEFTHALHDADQSARRVNAPTYIDEGFATLFESGGMVGDKFIPRKVSRLFYEIREAACKGEHVPWERFCQLTYHQYHQKDRSLNYCQSRYMFVYLYDTGKLKRWYENYCETYHRDKTGRIAWEMTYGKAFNEIEKDWVAWLKAIKRESRKEERWDGPYLGVEFEEADNGVALYKVELDSPAVKGGLHDGDIVTQADDVQIKTYNNLIDFLNKHKPGDEVKFKILRGKEEMTVSVTLGKRPEGK